MAAAELEIKSPSVPLFQRGIFLYAVQTLFGKEKLSFPGRLEPFELLERFERFELHSNSTSWNRELLENAYGFLWRSKNRGGDISGFVSRHQARRRPLTFLPFAQECRVLSHRLERLP